MLGIKTASKEFRELKKRNLGGDDSESSKGKGKDKGKEKNEDIGKGELTEANN